MTNEERMILEQLEKNLSTMIVEGFSASDEWAKLDEAGMEVVRNKYPFRSSFVDVLGMLIDWRDDVAKQLIK